MKSRSETIAKSPAAQADRLVNGLFETVAAQPTPEHLVDLADELEFASKSGRLKRPGEAA